MRGLRKHIVKSLIAGIVALLPIVGLVVTVVYFENQVAGTWLRNQGFYFFGLGILLAFTCVYLVGLFVSNVIGRWIWKSVDRVVDNLPIMGSLYQTLKQILGYGEGPDAIFQRVVFVSTKEMNGDEIGLVTNEQPRENPGKIAVFLPSAPSPTTGRLVFVEPSKIRDAKMSVSQALKSLVSIGALEVDSED